MGMKLLIILSFLTFVQCKLLNLSCQEISEFVDGHNEKRSQVAGGKIPRQPGTSAMKKMVWDEELRQMAANWAAKNPKMHNPMKNVPSGRFSVGENLYWYTTSDTKYKLSPRRALDAWFNEHFNFTYKPVDRADFDSAKPAVGHYTQMIWHDSIYLGCAISQVEERPWNKFTVVCNYGPSGNWLGSAPYKIGPASEKLICDSDDVCKRPYGPNC